jgi:hypothetical protein
MMKKSDKVAGETAMEIKETEVTEAAAEDTTAAEAVAEPEAQVYCGPSVRGVARQYTVYSGGLPEAVKGFIDKHPIASQLIVPVSKFPEMRTELETKGSRAMLIYNKLRSEL